MRREKKSIEKMSFEEALSELETIVKKIDTGEEDLESIIKNFERGVELKNYCQKTLNSAKMKIKQITDKELLVAEESSDFDDS